MLLSIGVFSQSNIKVKGTLYNQENNVRLIETKF